MSDSGDDEVRRETLDDLFASDRVDELYEISADYWAAVPATTNGVLGGYGHLSPVDIRSSKRFLQAAMKQNGCSSDAAALDCGAGIGRITRDLLAPLFKHVDLVEPDASFAAQARTLSATLGSRLGRVFENRLDQFQYSRTYDLVWVQWVLNYLTDDDLLDFLKRSKEALSEHGIIVIKENVILDRENSRTVQVAKKKKSRQSSNQDDTVPASASSSTKATSHIFEYDAMDSSVTRCHSHFLFIFEQAGLTVFKEKQMIEMPNDLFPVMMYALK